jgi:predicted metalloprotease
MKWESGPRSKNLEDQRDGRRPSRRGRGGKRRRTPIALGCGGVLALMVFGVCGKMILPAFNDTPRVEQKERRSKRDRTNKRAKKRVDKKKVVKGTASEEKLVDFVSFVLDDVQKVFKRKVEADGKRYTDAKLVVFDDKVRTRCGSQTSRVGPFYCPPDKKAFLDISFFRELDQLGGPGDFAQAYVVAHELAHHVQNITGISAMVKKKQRQHPRKKYDWKQRQELQADCFAGAWAHSTKQRGLLERGDVKEGLDAAAAIGDDRLRKRAGRAVDPETWTHGSSAMRVRWFKKGMRRGRFSDCDTYNALKL